MYLQIGDKKILLLEKVSGCCKPKRHVECASVCYTLDEYDGAREMYLILESDENSSNKYRLKYDVVQKVKKVKMLNT